MSAGLRIANVCKHYQGPPAVCALQDIDLSIEAGSFTVLLGPSGCGKTTLLNCMAGFEQVSSGSIHCNDIIVTNSGPDRGVVFQDYALFPWRTVLGNVLFGLRSTGWSRKAAREQAARMLRLVRLEGFEHAYPHTLSGGMKQRVAIARALAYEPAVLLMDEPFGALDAQTRKLMQQELVRIWRSLGTTIVFVTHSVIEAACLAQRIVVFTRHPGHIKGIIEVPLDYPRGYTDAGYLDIRGHALSLLEDEVVDEQGVGLRAE